MTTTYTFKLYPSAAAAKADDAMLAVTVDAENRSEATRKANKFFNSHVDAYELTFCYFTWYQGI